MTTSQVTLFAGCGGTDPHADWKSSEALRACWIERCRGDEAVAKAAFLKFAADSKLSGLPFAEKV